MHLPLLALFVIVAGLVGLIAAFGAPPRLTIRQGVLAGGALLALLAAMAFSSHHLILGTLAGGLAAWLLTGARGIVRLLALRPGRAKVAKVQPQTVTDHLEVTVDRATGDTTHRVLKGIFTGRSLEELKAAEAALLWHDCRVSDPASAALIERLLDRNHPTWREDVARGEAEMRDRDGRLFPKDAYELLDLKPGASEDEIRRAHRELMLKVHPDRGGSTYLAAQINEAKDVLLALIQRGR